MSVYKPAKSRFFHIDFVQNGRRIHGSSGVETRRQAEAIERKWRNDAALGLLDDAARMTLDQAAGRWWEERGKHLRSAAGVEQRLDALLTLMGKDSRLADITTATVSAVIEKRRAVPFTRGKGRKAKRFLPSDSTVNRCTIDTLRPILRRAKKRWGAKGLPEIDWGELRLAEPKPKPRDFTDADIAAAHAALPPHWRDFAHITARYGLRLAEMFFPLDALDVADRDDARVLLANRKGSDDHTVPLAPEDAAMLAARLGRARAADLKTVWFREMKFGKLKALTYYAAGSAMLRAMRKAGLREAKGAKGAHDLRHHAAMRFLRATGNLKATQRLLGHATSLSTEVYAHALEQDVRAGIAAVSRNSPEPAPGVIEKDVEDQRAKG